MGIGYDGACFYGLLYDEYSEDDEHEGWPEATRKVFEAAGIEDEDSDAFREWLRMYLRVPPWWSDGKEVRPYADFGEDMKARCLEAFGVPGFETGYLGYIDYPVYYIAPQGVAQIKYRGGRVPKLDPESHARWQEALEQLRSALPGAGRPGLYFGCSVG